MKVIERYATAAIADDLKDRGPLSDLHILTAAGLVGVSDTWASSLFRLKYSNDAKEYPSSLEGAESMARTLSFRLKWKTTPDKIARLAKQTLNYWLADLCPTCLGRGALAIPGTPILEDQPCDQCTGTGRRKLPQAGNMLEYAEALLYMLDEAERRAGGKMMAKLADDMNLNA